MSKLSDFICAFSVRPSLEPGWLEGNLEGKVGFVNQFKFTFYSQVGLVPENYVEFLS